MQGQEIPTAPPIGDSEEASKKYTLKDLFKNIGPGSVICATIVGPGTVTTCTLAGVNYQYALLWAVVFSIVAAIILQMMASRIGIASGRSLGEVIYDTYDGSWLRYLFAAIIFVTIGFGNAAFQSGNMAGAVLGIQAVFPDFPTAAAGLLLAVIVFVLLWTGRTKVIEKIMTAMVFIMVVLFVITAIVVQPDLGQVVAGFAPSIPEGAILVTIGVVGTTVIPHVIFLHSSLAAEKWAGRNKHNALVESNFDTIFNLVLCGLITSCIVITGAAMYGTGATVSSGLDMARQLEPLVGDWAGIVFGLGLFAAGITSALAAPMSAAYALCSVMRWSTDMKAKQFRVIWIIVLVAGTIVTVSGYSPVQVILAAQAFNGVMLPIAAVILLIMANNKQALGAYRNTAVWNVLGVLVIVVTLILAGRTLFNVFSSL